MLLAYHFAIPTNSCTLLSHLPDFKGYSLTSYSKTSFQISKLSATVHCYCYNLFTWTDWTNDYLCFV